MCRIFFQQWNARYAITCSEWTAFIAMNSNYLIPCMSLNLFRLSRTTRKFSKCPVNTIESSCTQSIRSPSTNIWSSIWLIARSKHEIVDRRRIRKYNLKLYLSCCQLSPIYLFAGIFFNKNFQTMRMTKTSSLMRFLSEISAVELLIGDYWSF